MNAKNVAIPVHSSTSSPVAKPAKPSLEQRLKGFALGALAACAAVTFTNPFEVIKTRLQLQGELESLALREKTTTADILHQQRVYRGPISALFLIGRQEGLKGLQKGLIPAYGYQVMMNGTRLGLYEPLRDTLQSGWDYMTSRESGLPPLVPIMVLSGAMSGFAGAFLGSPLFLIKTRMQSYSPAMPSVGQQHAYASQGMVKGLTAVYRAEGLRGLWRGSGMAMMRTGAGSSVQLSSYDLNKQFLLSTGYFTEGPRLGLSASLLTSLAVVFVMNPFDVASTRMYNQKANAEGQFMYKSGVDCLVKTVKGEGLFSLYKGASAHYLRIGPHTILTLTLFDVLKRFFM
ncbi:hypothetical protein SmJEL517_g05093 [Synchytrium microbalum]|uniref:Uncharacterized protein n=1 Tax=Synchytrium microbalum TaxID=1806994 RepID=A0A507C0J4_9FUNG|nr:uncharacterized protein SmJEL517_g05093 [Synchytrium microbalum]TPX31584.1 hypothetical protein SmJEL517_g05093 [Synchytrium microbalum]